MTIGIDISQTTYEQTGVSNYLINLLENLVKIDHENNYVLFFSSLRRDVPKRIKNLEGGRVKIKKFKLPPTILDLVWNKLHLVPIERFIDRKSVV